MIGWYFRSTVRSVRGVSLSGSIPSVVPAPIVSGGHLVEIAPPPIILPSVC